MGQFSDETSEKTPDGRRWPRPTPVYMRPGDATIAMYHIPHSGSRNENGNSSRKSPIFALVNKKRHPNHKVEGHSDHPDRYWNGGFDFPDGNAQYERSKLPCLICITNGMECGNRSSGASKAGKSNVIFDSDGLAEKRALRQQQTSEKAPLYLWLKPSAHLFPTTKHVENSSDSRQQSIRS